MLNRFLYAENQGNTAQDQVLGNRTQIEIDNPNTPDYYKTASFPQPAIIGMGYVTSGGAKGIFFQPSAWSLNGSHSTGVYTITHNLPNNRYFCNVIAQNTANINVVVDTADNTTTIRTFNTAGTLTDSGFMFVFYLIS